MSLGEELEKLKFSRTKLVFKNIIFDKYIYYGK